MRTKAILVGAILILAPSAAEAAKAAIVPVEYVHLQPGEAADAARQVEDKVAEGAIQAGFEVLRGAAVTDAVKRSPACAASAKERACLEAVAEALGADEAIAVSVTDDDHTSYRVEIVHARRAAVTDERTAGFFVVLEWVRGAVALALQKPASQAEEPPATQSPPSAEKDPSDRSDASDGSDASPPAPLPANDAHSKPLRPAIFWTGVGITGALVVAYAATDIATYARYKGLKDESAAERSQADWDAAHRLQVADRVLLGFAIAAAAATTVMGFFTDFAPSQPSPTGGGLGWGPFALPNGGGLVLEGRF